MEQAMNERSVFPIERGHDYDPLSILIVDDDWGILNSLRTLFTSMGCKVRITQDAFDAFTILMRSAVDLLIVDMRMPQVNGLELIKKIKEIKPSLPAILITAYDSIQIKNEISKIEGAQYIEKPFGHEQLKKTIRELNITI
jgi:DNA-binding NtrC family response regulator